MKIIIVHYKFFIQGGPERYLFKFMELAKEQGHDIIPFSIKYKNNLHSDYTSFFVGNNNISKSFKLKNYNIFTLAKGFINEFSNHEADVKFKRLIKLVSPDVIYALIPGQLNNNIFKIAHKYGIPTIHRVSDFRMICGNNILLNKERHI